MPGFQRDGSARAAISIPALQLNAIVLALLLVNMVIFEGFLDTVTGLALSLDVVGMVLDTGPAFVGTAFGSALDHHVVAFLVSVHIAQSVHVAGRVSRHTVEWSMTLDTVDDLLLRGGFQRLRVGAGDGGQRRVGRVVPGIQCGVIRASVVPRRASTVVQVVDRVGRYMVFLGGVAGAVCHVLLLGQGVEWSM